MMPTEKRDHISAYRDVSMTRGTSATQGKVAHERVETPAIVVSGLTRTFGLRTALDNVSFGLPSRAFLSVFGPNGAGKTTLVRILATLLAPTSGTAHVLGLDAVQDVIDLRQRIGLISHAPLLYPDLTAEENLLFFAEMYGVEQPQARVTELLEAVELDHRRLDITRTFSRGMLQRLSIARALLHRPEVLFLDEPYSGLDPHAMDILDGLVAQIRKDHTLVMISHDLNKGLELCTHALVLSRGRVVLFEPREALDERMFRETYRLTVGMGVA